MIETFVRLSAFGPDGVSMINSRFEAERRMASAGLPSAKRTALIAFYSIGHLGLQGIIGYPARLTWYIEWADLQLQAHLAHNALREPMTNIVQHGSSLISCPTPCSLHPHYMPNSCLWPCLNYGLLGGSDKYLSMVEGRTVGFVLFQSVLRLCEMQTASSRIRKWVAVSISKEDYGYVLSSFDNWYDTVQLNKLG